MNTFKKALLIGFGSILLASGLGIILFFLLVQSTEITAKVTGVVGGMFIAGFGWWLLRRGSKNVWDALSWLFAQILR